MKRFFYYREIRYREGCRDISPNEINTSPLVQHSLTFVHSSGAPKTFCTPYCPALSHMEVLCIESYRPYNYARTESTVGLQVPQSLSVPTTQPNQSLSEVFLSPPPSLSFVLKLSSPSLSLSAAADSAFLYLPLSCSVHHYHGTDRPARCRSTVIPYNTTLP